MILAGIFLLLYAAALTLAPVVRLRATEGNIAWQHWAGLLAWLAAAFLTHQHTARRLPERDPYLMPLAALLTGWGLLMIWRLYPDFGLRQTLWLLVAAGLFLAGLRLPADLEFLRRYKYVWLTGGLLLTALTLLFGTNPAGGTYPRLWLGCCGIYLQPSEPLKLLLIIYLAAYLSSGIDREIPASATSTRRLLPQLAPTLLMAGLALLLLVAQRDLGTASIFLFLYTTILYITSGQRRILLAGFLSVLLAGAAGYALFDVVRLRVDAWLNPWLDPSGRSYQIVQSLLAVANGGLVGRGPGMGSPGVVPVPHSDFIFAAIAEETGLVGSIGLLLLLALAATRGMRIALNAPDAYRRYLAAGLTTHLVAQSVLIIGGNLRLLPLTGVTLPFVSYGGSSLLTSFLSLLFLLQISSSSNQEKARLPNPRPYLLISALLLAGLAANALAAGWWSIYRSPALLSRTDNPRRAIADRYVYRGAILDRSEQPLARTQGSPGSYARWIEYPPLSPIIGYTNPVYGQAGLEDSLDAFLRGTQGNTSLLFFWRRLLDGHPPSGLNVRTSLDLSLQRTADDLIGDRRGALVLLNAQSGEILVMASHPVYDANRLEQNWDKLIQNPEAPLLNRAALGLYPAGALEGLLFPGGSASAALDPAPQVRLPVGTATISEQGTLLLSPLQAALAAATLSAQGIRPAPVLALAVQNPQAGWVILDSLGEPVQARSPADAQAAGARLADPQGMFWQSVTVAPNGPEESVTWWVGGSLPAWQGAPLAAAVLLEENNPALAEAIGREILEKAGEP
jgi:cell division protein FtsW (lipid II flippase)